MKFPKIDSRRTRVGVTTALAVSVALIVASCSSSTPTASTSPAQSTAANLAITFVPKTLGNPYFVASDKGGSDAITEFGGTYAEVAPATATPSSQVSFINTLTQQKVGAIVISANDPKVPCDALNAARKAGVKVVAFDSDTDSTCRDVYVSQASAEGIAKSQVTLIAKQIGDAGKIAIISGTPNAVAQNEWIKLMKADIAANHPNITVVATVYGNYDAQTSFDKTAGLLQSYPDLKGIVAPDAVALPAAARYLQTSQYKGKVFLTGLSLPNQMKAYIADDTVIAFALWNPVNLGYLAAYTGKALIDGTITGAEGDTFKAGKLGSYTVGKDGIVLLGDPTVFDKSNIANFDF